ncbi:MAG TPA: DUF1003 domain-containing protein [Capsulimonadaceae bacterium]|jgi:uncharacterized membrane protein
MASASSIQQTSGGTTPVTVDELTKRNVEAITRLENAADEQRTFGERVADGIARLVGSWPFIIMQSIILAIWIVLNILGWIKHWDPYPFILLNLALSFQAAYTGPIVMMSQNRQSQLAERRNRLDLQINLLSEQENTETIRLLRLLCEKHGIDMAASSNAEVFMQETQPDVVITQLDEAAAMTTAQCDDQRNQEKEQASQS